MCKRHTGWRRAALCVWVCVRCRGGGSHGSRRVCVRKCVCVKVGTHRWRRWERQRERVTVGSSRNFCWPLLATHSFINHPFYLLIRWSHLPFIHPCSAVIALCCLCHNKCTKSIFGSQRICYHNKLKRVTNLRTWGPNLIFSAAKRFVFGSRNSGYIPTMSQ